MVLGAHLTAQQARRLLDWSSTIAVISLSLAAILYLGLRLGSHYKVQVPFLGAPARVVAAAAGEGQPASPSPGVDSASEAGAQPPPAALIPVPSGSDKVWLPILMYHYVRVAPAGDTVGFGLSVTPPDFQRQMQWLRDHGYTTVTVHDAVLMVQQRKPMPNKPIALTFDDGYRDFYSAAAPVLRRLGMTATNYVPTRLVGLPAYMTWDQVRELDSQGFEMAAHTEFHVALKGAQAPRAHEEVYGAKNDLESQLGHPVVDFAYPYGAYDAGVVKLVNAAGYESATTTNNGGWHTASQLLTLTRIRVSGGEGLDYWIRPSAATRERPRLSSGPARGGDRPRRGPAAATD